MAKKLTRRRKTALKRKKRISQRRANMLLARLRKGGTSCLTDDELGKLIIRTDRKTKKQVVRLLNI